MLDVLFPGLGDPTAKMPACKQNILPWGHTLAVVVTFDDMSRFPLFLIIYRPSQMRDLWVSESSISSGLSSLAAGGSKHVALTAFIW